MRWSGHHDDHGVREFEQVGKGPVRLDTELFHHLSRPLGSRLDETSEADPGEIAENSDVVEAEAARADDTDARKCLQITTPRSLASTKRMSSLTSGNTSSSVCARSIACETLRSERKNSR